MGFVWGCQLVAFLEFLLLIEPAEIGSLNLSWGYMSAMYILFAYCLVQFEELHCKEKIHKLTYSVGIAVFVWHVLIGLYAFIYWAGSYRHLMG